MNMEGKKTDSRTQEISALSRLSLIHISLLYLVFLGKRWSKNHCADRRNDDFNILLLSVINSFFCFQRARVDMIAAAEFLPV